MFCYIEVSDNSTNVNDVQDSSITYSNRGNRTGFVNICLKYGNNSILRDNITRNYCKTCAAFLIEYGLISINNSIFDENYADLVICGTSYSPAVYNSIVFINNTVSSISTYGLIDCLFSTVYIENSYIANNSLLDNQYYFSGYEGNCKFTISNSYIDPIDLSRVHGVEVTYIQMRNVSIELNLLSTGLCPIGNYFVYIDKVNTFTHLLHAQRFGKYIATLVSKR